MTWTYFRNNKVIKAPAYEGGNPKEGDLQRILFSDQIRTAWFVCRNSNWTKIQYEQVPNEIKTLLLIGGA